MRIPKTLMQHGSWGLVLFLTVGYFMTGMYAEAQTCGTSAGYNTVWGTCSNGSTNEQGSIAMVDASQLQGSDICTQIQNAMKYISAANTYGIVVDARGINPGTIQVCQGGNPWASWANNNPNLPSVVLLPSGTIQISSAWAMPQLARLVGEGSGVTILQATSAFGDMIDMGNPTLCPQSSFNDCPAIAIEHLGLNGGSFNVNGIVNKNGQELSYVQDVAFTSIGGTALSLNQYSNNSGPYSNLTMSSVGSCVSINGSVGTRGIHGLNCSTSGTATAIDVEGSNNSLEDISLTGNAGADGILVGYSATAHNNVLFNIRGGGFSNLIHISNKSASGQNQCPGQYVTYNNTTTAYNACDITIMGVTNGSGNTIYDQVGGVTLTDSNLGMYILGEPVQYGKTNNNDTFLGNSHFTTSPNWPTWVVGASQPGSSCQYVGSLFSVTGTSATPPTLLECESSGWATVK